MCSMPSHWLMCVHISFSLVDVYVHLILIGLVVAQALSLVGACGYLALIGRAMHSMNFDWLIDVYLLFSLV